MHDAHKSKEVLIIQILEALAGDGNHCKDQGAEGLMHDLSNCRVSIESENETREKEKSKLESFDGLKERARITFDAPIDREK